MKFSNTGPQGPQMSTIPQMPQIPQPKEINLLNYWMVIGKRKWLIAAVLLAVLIGVGLKTFTMTPLYTAKGTLLIEQEPNILTFEQIFQIETFRDDFYQTQYKLLQNKAVIEDAVERLKLADKAMAALKSNGKRKNIRVSEPLLSRALTESILGRVKVSPVRLTRLVELSYEDPEPKAAAEIVNAIFDSFIDMHIESKYAATEQATEFLTGQIAGLTKEIEKKERELQSYGAQKNIIALSDKETTIVERLGELNRALTDAQIDRVKKEANYNEIKGASSDYIPEALTNPLIQKLREDYVKLSREYIKKQEAFKPELPEMQRLKKELESAKSLLENEIQNLIKGAYSDCQAALKKEKSMEAVFNRQKQESIQLNSSSILYNSLKIEIENKKSMLDSLLRRESETGVSARLKGLRTSNIKIVNRAEVPLSPSKPKKKQNMILALVVGLFMGLGLAFFLEYLDNTVKSSEDVEKYAELPTLGIVPLFSEDGFRKGYGYGYGYGYGHKRRRTRGEGDKGREGSGRGGGRSEERGVLRGGGTASAMSARSEEERAGGAGRDSGLRHGMRPEEEGKEVSREQPVNSIELITHLAPKSKFSESYRSIIASLLLSSADPNLKAFVVTSPLPEEGKTATICNLAATLAQENKRVLIVDADLRKPRQHRIFNVKNVNGLSNYLAQNLEIKELIKPTQVPNLFLINAGPVPPNPTVLLGSEKMGHFIKALKGTFDYILFDSPPFLVTTDAMVLAPKSDGILLVVWGGKTSREALKRMKEKFDLVKMKPLGVIINRINLKEHDYYYKHHYYYYYEQK